MTKEYVLDYIFVLYLQIDQHYNHVTNERGYHNPSKNSYQDVKSHTHATHAADT